MIGHINFDAKITGKRSAGNPHATFDEAGDGNVAISVHAPLLDPTERRTVASLSIGASSDPTVMKPGNAGGAKGSW